MLGRNTQDPCPSTFIAPGKPRLRIPITLPTGRKDAADYITKLPKQESDCRNGKRRD